MYCCEKYHKSITVQHDIADCVSWVPGLTFWTYEQTGVNERTLKKELSFVYGDFTVFNCIHYLQPSRSTIAILLEDFRVTQLTLCYLVYPQCIQ